VLMRCAAWGLQNEKPGCSISLLCAFCARLGARPRPLPFSAAISSPAACSGRLSYGPAAGLPLRVIRCGAFYSRARLSRMTNGTDAAFRRVAADNNPYRRRSLTAPSLPADAEGDTRPSCAPNATPAAVKESLTVRAGTRLAPDTGRDDKGERRTSAEQVHDTV
jgi:hypothetical protein